MGVYLFSTHRWCRPRKGRWHWISATTCCEVLTACGRSMAMDERTQDFSARPTRGRCVRCLAARRRFLATYRKGRGRASAPGGS